MSIVLDGTTGVTAPAFDGTLDATDLTGDVAAAQITTALNATGSAPVFACRAWVNFNGTGTVAIRASGNVSSITDNGVGTYTVNFTVAMQDSDYAYSISKPNANGAAASTAVLAGSLSIATRDGSGLLDFDNIAVAIFR